MKIKKDTKIICRDCGENEQAKIITKGNIIIEILLYLFYLVPGIIYTLWRVSNRYPACPNCESKRIVLLESKAGKKLYKEFN